MPTILRNLRSNDGILIPLGKFSLRKTVWLLVAGVSITLMAARGLDVISTGIFQIGVFLTILGALSAIYCDRELKSLLEEIAENLPVLYDIAAVIMAIFAITYITGRWDIVLMATFYIGICLFTFILSLAFVDMKWALVITAAALILIVLLTTRFGLIVPIATSTGIVAFVSWCIWGIAKAFKIEESHDEY